MPEFFSAAEIAARNRGYRRIVRQCRTVLLSSFEAQKDLATFDSSAVAKSEVLNFAAGAFASYRSDMPLTELRTKYGIAPQYFLLPNQFWAHKNHRVVIDAIAEMTRRGSAAEVVCTGSTHDRRQPRYFAELMQYAERKGVLSSFRVLGQIPYVDLVALMRGARAIINPSMFEGWSTSVEEAKALGVPVILSDIPVHREQNPDRATYFRPADSDELAEALVRYMYGQPESKNSCKHVDVLERSMLRYVTFGRRYQEIVLSTLQRET
jgi:glycosyltransferase involved in cell wall biosynthesis